MNKMKLLTAVALAGLLGLSARAGISVNYSAINIHLTVLLQTNSTVSGSITKYNVTKVKVTNKEVLARVAAEFGAFPAGAQLVINGFFGGTFSVLAKDGTVLLANASVPVAADAYDLRITNPGNDLYTGQASSKADLFDIITAGEFYWQDATGANYLEVFGPAVVRDYEANPANSPESFEFSGVEDGGLGGHAAIVVGEISGAGKNTSRF